MSTDGGPAFPTYEKIGTEVINDCGDETPVFGSFGGMTLRDYFAAKAMQGFFASFGPEQNPLQTKLLIPNATRCYEMADAMLKAREA